MTTVNEVSFDDWDEQNNLRSEQETDFSHVVSRRAFLSGGAVLGASAFLLGTSALMRVLLVEVGVFGLVFIWSMVSRLKSLMTIRQAMSGLLLGLN